MKDPIVEEVRKHRKEHTQKFNGELSRICEDLQSIQKSSGHVVVRLSPKKGANQPIRRISNASR
jgi:hypothetical protein